jgi:hypothetical protein
LCRKDRASGTSASPWGPTCTCVRSRALRIRLYGPRFLSRRGRRCVWHVGSTSPRLAGLTRPHTAPVRRRRRGPARGGSRGFVFVRFFAIISRSCWRRIGAVWPRPARSLLSSDRGRYRKGEILDSPALPSAENEMAEEDNMAGEVHDAASARTPVSVLPVIFP